MHHLYRIILRIISYLPIWILYFFSDLLYLIIYKILRYRLNIVKKNINNCFPEKSNKDKKLIEKKFYKHLCDIIMEVIKSFSISKDEINKRVIFKNIDLFHKYKNDSIILAVSHYGNWELGLQAISINVNQKMIGVYKKFNNQLFNILIKKNRERNGSVLVEIKEIYRYLLKNIDTPKIIGLLADQSPEKNNSNYWKEFMLQETIVYNGPEKISNKFNYPVLFCSMKKVKRGKYEVYIEELYTKSSKIKKDDITSIYLRKVEKAIKENPEFYLWSHNRWKHTR